LTAIFRFFVDNWKFSLLLTLILTLAGVFGVTALKRETFPPVDFARVTVVTIYPGASPEEVQEKVTNIIEDELRGIAGVKDIRSTSQSERSEVDIRVDIDNADTKKVVADVQRAVQRASGRLPADLPDDPVVQESNAEEIPVIEVAVIGPNENRLRDLTADRLKSQFEDVRGVKAVRLSGFRNREFQILLDPRKMAANFVGIVQVTEAVRARVRNIPAGFVRSEESIQQVRVLGQVREASELGEIFIRSNDSGRALRVKDVARAIEGMEEPSVLASYNGEPATLLIVQKRGDADSLDIMTGVLSKLEAFRTTLDPKLKVEVYNNEGSRIEERLNIVVSNAVTGLVIVLVVLFLFLPGSLGLMSALSLPICVLGTTAYMVAAGANFNIITMLALIIALGMLVDNSSVVSENYTALREKGVERAKAAVESVAQLWIPLTASTLTTIAAFLPMMVTKGVLGQFIRWIPIVVSAALLLSLIEAFLLLPARLQFVLRKDISGAGAGGAAAEQKPDRFQRFRIKFEGFIGWTIRRRYLTATAMFGLFMSGFVVTAVFNRFELFPEENVEFYVARFEAPVQTSIQATDRITRDLARLVREKLGPEIAQHIIGRAGVQQTDGGDPLAKNGENVGLLIIIVPPDQAQKLKMRDVLDRLREISKPPGLTNLSFEVIAGGPPVGKPLTLTLRSENAEALRKMADLIKAEVAKIDGAQDVRDDENSSGNEYRFRKDHEAGAFVGINVEQVGLNLRTALQGFVAAQLTDGSNEFDLRIRFQEDKRADLGHLRQVEILNSSQGGASLIPLNRIGTFEEGPGPTTRKHFEFKRSITVTADVDDTRINSQSLNAKAREIVGTVQRDFPGVEAKFGGEEETTQESFQSLLAAMVLAIMGIFAILVFIFKSYLKPALVLTSVPLGLIGVTYAFAIHQRPLSFIALIGIIGLAGVVVNSAIILVEFIDQLLAEKQLSLDEALKVASGRRLRAVLVTGLTTIAGLMPTAYGIGGYDPILVPMTLALAWGLATGTVLTLIWVPAGYRILIDLREFVNAAKVRLLGLAKGGPQVR
jgi:multidrug efflux pump subunit AcrB